MRWILAWVLSAHCVGAETAPAFAVLRDLNETLYAIAETSGGSDTEWAAVEAEAVAALEALPDEAVTGVDARGRSPLMQAASDGLWPAVAALLTREAVVAGVDLRDEAGLSAHDYAVLAQRQTFLACVPNIDNPFVLVPLLVKLPYYGDRTPYPRIRAALDAAGAQTDEAAAKAFWLARCPNDDPATRAAVSGSADLAQTLVVEAAAVLQAQRRAEIAAQLAALGPWLETQSDEAQAAFIAEFYRRNGMAPPAAGKETGE